MLQSAAGMLAICLTASPHMCARSKSIRPIASRLTAICGSIVPGATDGCVKLWDMRQTAQPRDTAVYGRGSATLQHPTLEGKEPRAQAETTALTGSTRRCGITCLQQPARGEQSCIARHSASAAGTVTLESVAVLLRYERGSALPHTTSEHKSGVPRSWGLLVIGEDLAVDRPTDPARRLAAAGVSKRWSALSAGFKRGVGTGSGGVPRPRLTRLLRQGRLQPRRLAPAVRLRRLPGLHLAGESNFP